MTDRRIRCEIERFDVDGFRTSYAIVVDPPKLDAATRQRVRALLDQCLDDLRALGITDPAGTAAACLIEMIGEERAYERVAARRGVLAL